MNSPSPQRALSKIVFKVIAIGDCGFVQKFEINSCMHFYIEFMTPPPMLANRVGKTSLMNQYVNNKFTHKYRATIGM